MLGVHHAGDDLKPVSQKSDESGEDHKGQPIHHERVHHVRIDAGTFASTDDGLRMLCAEPSDGHVHERDVEESEDRQDRGENLRLSARGVLAQDEIADVDEPQDERAGEACVPCPPDAPDGTRPEGSCDENDGAEDNSDFGGGNGDGIGVASR